MNNFLSPYELAYTLEGNSKLEKENITIFIKVTKELLNHYKERYKNSYVEWNGFCNSCLLRSSAAIELLIKDLKEEFDVKTN